MDMLVAIIILLPPGGEPLERVRNGRAAKTLSGPLVLCYRLSQWMSYPRGGDPSSPWALRRINWESRLVSLPNLLDLSNVDVVERPKN